MSVWRQSVTGIIRHARFGVHPFVSILIAAPLFFALGYALQRSMINRMIAAPVLLIGTVVLSFFGRGAVFVTLGLFLIVCGLIVFRYVPRAM